MYGHFHHSMGKSRVMQHFTEHSQWHVLFTRVLSKGTIRSLGWFLYPAIDQYKQTHGFSSSKHRSISRFGARSTQTLSSITLSSLTISTLRTQFSHYCFLPPALISTSAHGADTNA